MGLIAKLQTWKVSIGGAIQNIKVLATQPLDLTQQNGTAGPFDFYDNTKAYIPGQVVVVPNNIVIAGINVVPGVYGCRQAVTANGTGNLIPQFPMPVGTANIYWILISLGPQQVSICQNGTKQIYINSSSAF